MCLLIFEGYMLSGMLICGVRCDSIIFLDKIRQMKFNGCEQKSFLSSNQKICLNWMNSFHNVWKSNELCGLPVEGALM